MKGDKYDENYIVTPLTSSFVELVLVDDNTSFVNIIGSSGDKYDKNRSKAWIEVMRSIYREKGLPVAEQQKLNRCCARSHGYINPDDDEQVLPNGCNGMIVGGHILLDEKYAREVEKNGEFVLLPICNRHNTRHLSEESTGAGYYMKTSESIYGLKMNAYHMHDKVKEYFKQYSIENVAII